MCFLVGLGTLDRLAAFALNKAYYALFWHNFFQEKPQLIFLGDSRVKSGFIPSIIEESTGLNTYNLSQDGMSILYTKTLLQWLLKHYVPKYIVVSVMHLDREQGSIDELAPFIDQDTFRDLLQYYSWQTRVAYSFNTLKFNSQLTAMISQWLWGMRKQTLNGYKPLTGFQQRLPQTEPLQPEPLKKTPSPDFAVGEDLLNKLVQMVQAAGAELIFVEMPTQREKSSLSYEAFRQLALQTNTPFLDFSKGSPLLKTPLSDELFWDEGHLNHHGAVYFSKLFAQHIPLKKNTSE